MSKIITLLAAAVLLFGFASAEAARPNLITNGSFANGLNGWEMHSQYALVSGFDGSPALSLERGFARYTAFRPNVGKKYKLTFRYKGKLNVFTQNGNYLKSTDWSEFSQTFVADSGTTSLWFMGFDNNPLLLDQISLVRLKN
jgi:hypothetical protein